MNQDITFCMEDGCNNEECFRHRKHACPGFAHSFAYLGNTEYCPLNKEKEEENNG